eukprot:TRINITY_DN38729_c0_g2_i1.p1 TRINITY_DN38729_c0_g2~~TRINITY_DN38729_c0_g2_i1.p1  ORF type:complete len:494 (-),score=89.92 TRINITY_DN38729_c0_g2_i1:23-1504(-)
MAAPSSPPFPVGSKVILQPLPFTLIRYGAYGGQEFDVKAAKEVPEDDGGGFTFDLIRGSTELADVNGVHLCEPAVIVRARAECVNAMSIGAFLRSVDRFVVPFFQRKYCWAERQWEGLWNDVVAMKSHPLGRIVLYEETWRFTPTSKLQQQCGRQDGSESRKALVIVDGQQRITSSVVLLAVMRDAAADRFPAVVDRVQEILLPRASGRRSEGQQSSGTSLGDDCLLDAVLIPTEDDRCAFAAVLQGCETDSPSCISNASVFFRRRIHDFMETGGDLSLLVESLLENVVVLRFVLDDGNAVGRFFEELDKRNTLVKTKLNEKSPGVPLGEIDLLRNFVLGHFESVAVRTDVYNSLWLELERCTNASGGDMAEFTLFLRHFLAEQPCTATSPAALKLSPLPSGSAVAYSSQFSSLYGEYRALVAYTLQDATRDVSCEGEVRSLLERMLVCARSGKHLGKPEVPTPSGVSKPRRVSSSAMAQDAIAEGEEEEDSE